MTSLDKALTPTILNISQMRWKPQSLSLNISDFKDELHPRIEKRSYLCHQHTQSCTVTPFSILNVKIRKFSVCKDLCGPLIWIPGSAEKGTRRPLWVMFAVDYFSVFVKLHITVCTITSRVHSNLPVAPSGTKLSLPEGYKISLIESLFPHMSTLQPKVIKVFYI